MKFTEEELKLIEKELCFKTLSEAQEHIKKIEEIERNHKKTKIHIRKYDHVIDEYNFIKKPYLSILPSVDKANINTYDIEREVVYYVEDKNGNLVDHLPGDYDFIKNNFNAPTTLFIRLNDKIYQVYDVHFSYNHYMIIFNVKSNENNFFVQKTLNVETLDDVDLFLVYVSDDEEYNKKLHTYLFNKTLR